MHIDFLYRFIYKSAKFFSKLKQQLVFFLIMLFSIVGIFVLGIVSSSSGLGKFLADVMSPVSARDYMYNKDKCDMVKVIETDSNALTYTITGNAEDTVVMANSQPTTKDNVGVKKIKRIVEAPKQNNNGWLSVFAYFFGIIIFSGILIPFVTNLLRNMADRYLDGTLLRYSWKDHILFIGFDNKMVGCLKESCDKVGKKGTVVIAVPKDVAEIRLKVATMIDDDKTERIEVVQCDQNDIETLKKRGCVRSANKIYVIGQPDDPTHDTLNTQTMCKVIKDWVLANTKIEEKRMLIYIRNNSTIAMFKRFNFDPDIIWKTINIGDNSYDSFHKEDNHYERIFDILNTKCEFFNFCQDRAIQLLTDKRFRNAWIKHESDILHRRMHLVVIGMSDMGNAIVREALRLAHPSGLGTKFLITMVDDNAYHEMNYFIGRTRELFKYCRYSFSDYDEPSRDFNIEPQKDMVDVEFQFIKCDVANPKLMDYLLRCSKDEKQLLNLVICSSDPTQNMAVAMYLPPQMLRGDNAVPTWVFNDGDSTIKIFGQEKYYPDMRTFDFRDNAVLDSGTSSEYILIKETALEYDRVYKNRGNEQKKEWIELSATDRWSSFYSVMSMKILLALPEGFDKCEVEHNRWVVEKLSAGFIPTDDEQHRDVISELQHLMEQYPDWQNDENVISTIEDKRTVFNALKAASQVKGIRIHDDIRPYSELEVYTKQKDENLCKFYKETMRKYNIVS